MAEYWKSTPKYWCKFCSIYIKDTKFERQQHEATGRHQGNIQRSLRGLHREQENEQRNKARAQAEVARLNGLVPSESKTTATVASGSSGPPPTYQKRTEKKATLEDRKRQWEQLAAMGIALPEGASADLGLAGQWKTVSEEVVGEINEDGEFKAVALNKGVRKRKMDEEEQEREAAGELITKRKGWGQTYKSFPGSKGGDDDLDSLLGKKKTLQAGTKEDASETHDVKDEALKDEGAERRLQDIPTAEETDAKAESVAKDEDKSSAPAVTFKKRKKIAK